MSATENTFGDFSCDSLSLREYYHKICLMIWCKSRGRKNEVESFVRGAFRGKSTNPWVSSGQIHHDRHFQSQSLTGVPLLPIRKAQNFRHQDAEQDERHPDRRLRKRVILTDDRRSIFRPCKGAFSGPGPDFPCTLSRHDDRNSCVIRQGFAYYAPGLIVKRFTQIHMTDRAVCRNCKGALRRSLRLFEKFGQYSSANPGDTL